MIDRDSCFRKTLAELSREAQCSAGHIRKLFVKQYLIEPGEYRARLRLRRIMHYIEQTDLSLKEIADQVGMKHVTHLHLFLRERCGTTPRMLLKQYRGGINPLMNRIHSGHRHKSAVPRRRSSGNIRRPYKRQRL